MGCEASVGESRSIVLGAGAGGSENIAEGATAEGSMDSAGEEEDDGCGRGQEVLAEFSEGLCFFRSNSITAAFMILMGRDHRREKGVRTPYE